MNQDHLRYILQIRKYGSINKAATYNQVSQPYLSNILQNMENSLGIKLFFRTKSGVIPTTEGEEFFARANKFLNDYEDFQGYCETLTEDVFRIKIATVPFCYAEHAVVKTLQETPANRVDIRVSEHHSFNLPQQIRNGSYKLGFLGYNLFYDNYIGNTIRCNALRYVEVVRLTPEILVSKHHPALEELRADVSKMKDYPAVMQTGVSEDVVDIYDMFEDTSIKVPRKNNIMTDHNTLLYFVSTGAGLAITPHVNFYEDVLEKYEIEAIPIPELKDTISIGYLYDKEEELLPLHHSLIKHWKNTVFEGFQQKQAKENK